MFGSNSESECYQGTLRWLYGGFHVDDKDQINRSRLESEKAAMVKKDCGNDHHQGGSTASEDPERLRDLIQI
jgi:hypothetical protein